MSAFWTPLFDDFETFRALVSWDKKAAKNIKPDIKNKYYQKTNHTHPQAHGFSDTAIFKFYSPSLLASKSQAS